MNIENCFDRRYLRIDDEEERIDDFERALQKLLQYSPHVRRRGRWSHVMFFGLLHKHVPNDYCLSDGSLAFRTYVAPFEFNKEIAPSFRYSPYDSLTLAIAPGALLSRPEVKEDVEETYTSVFNDSPLWLSKKELPMLPLPERSRFSKFFMSFVLPDAEKMHEMNSGV
jgi:hypothetical protein